MTTKEPLKDLHSQHPVPVVWRDTYSEIVERFVDGDYGLERSVQHVLPISEETAAQISGYIADYGETLVQLDESVWDSSVSQWLGDRWEVLVDLCTESEGISDMILHSFVRENEDGFQYKVHLVYVP